MKGEKIIHMRLKKTNIYCKNTSAEGVGLVIVRYFLGVDSDVLWGWVGRGCLML